MRTWRWPALILVPVLVVAAVVAGTSLRSTGEESIGLADLALPVVAPEGAPGATWFCAGGRATTEGGAVVSEHLVVVSNTAEESRSIRLTAYPSDGEPVERTFDLDGRTRRDVRLHEMLQAPYVAALVEVDGGGVAVQQEVRGSAGRSVAPCASSPAASWYFPAGTTRAGSQFILSLFNPFPTDAVVDITFDTDDGARSPESFQGLVVPAGGLLPVDVGAIVTLRDELATAVDVRSGRLVVDQLLTADGVSLVLGAPLAQEAWLFPDGVGAAGFAESILLYNPNDQLAQVEVHVFLDDADINGVAEPFEISVGPHRYEAIDVLGDGRIPVGVGHSIVVRSVNEVGVVAERSIAGAEGEPGIGLTIGSPVVATRWVAAVGGVEAASGVTVAVMNGSLTDEVTVRVSLMMGGRIVEVGEVVLEPGGRRVIPLDLGPDGSNPTASVVIDGDQPIAVETRVGFVGGDFSYVVAAPALDTIAAPPEDLGALDPVAP